MPERIFQTGPGARALRILEEGRFFFCLSSMQVSPCISPMIAKLHIQNRALRLNQGSNHAIRELTSFHHGARGRPICNIFAKEILVFVSGMKSLHPDSFEFRPSSGVALSHRSYAVMRRRAIVQTLRSFIMQSHDLRTNLFCSQCLTLFALRPWVSPTWWYFA